MLRSHVLGCCLVLATGCGAPSARGGGPAPTRPTATVVVGGDTAHAVGRELARDGAGRVQVALHEGSTQWIDASRVRPEAIAIGDRVVVRWDATAAAREAEVVARHDRLLRLRFADGSVHLVSMGSVLAVLAAPLPGFEPVEGGGDDGDAAADERPAVDPARQVAWAGLLDWVPARAVRCDGGVTVLFADGTTATVPEADVVLEHLEPGARIAVRYQGGALSYLAMVLDVRPEGPNVRYDDGSEEVVGPDLVTHVIRPEDERVARPRGGICRQLTARRIPRVLVRRSRVWRTGTLQGCSDAGVARITTAEGETVERPAADLRVVVAAPGHGVLVPWGTEQYFATVTTTIGSEVTVRYEDGDEATVSTADLRLVLVPLTERIPEGERPTCP